MNFQVSLRKIAHQDHNFWCEAVPGTSYQGFEDLIKKLAKDEQQDKSYSFIIETKKGPIGFIQVFNVVRFPAHSGMIEIMILEKYRKLGYAKEGTTLLENFCFNEQKLMRLIAPISPTNEASKALFSSLGYRNYYTDPSAFFFKGKPSPHEIWVKVRQSH